MGDGFIIPLNGLTAGKNEFSWKVGKEFFESFGNSEVFDADLDVEVVVEKAGKYVGVDCEVVGHVVVECDRCLDELELPVGVVVRLSVKFGEAEPSEEHQDGEREVVFVSDAEAELDMSQIIYDYVCLDLPMQRMHDEGQCNPEVIRRLSGDVASHSEQVTAESPFAVLKDFIK